MLKDNISINILVKGKPITEYKHNDLIYVEGREGSEFEIEVKNHSYQRKEILISVDGLSINDGEPINPDGEGSQGYLINGYQTIRIPGWSLNNKSVASFVFEGKSKSYAAQSVNDGDVKNSGVIGLMVFSEKVKYTTNTITLSGIGVGQHPKFSGYPGGSPYRSFSANASLNKGIVGSGENASIYNSNTSFDDNLWVGSNSCGPVAMACSSVPDVEPIEQSLGAGFGKQKEFKTITVDFDRGTLYSTLVMYYDNARGLAKRGIDLSKKVDQPQPNPFPGKKSNCPLPEGYKG